jgi:hypothetical protein
MDVLYKFAFWRGVNAVADVPLTPASDGERVEVRRGGKSHPETTGSTSGSPIHVRESEVSDACDVYSDVDEEEELGALSLQDLPLEILELVLSKLKESTMLPLRKTSSSALNSRRSQRLMRENVRHVLAVAGVSRQWRDIAKRVLFGHPWEASSLGAFAYIHPNQMFSRSPLPPMGSRSGMIKCFVKRQQVQMQGGGPAITLYSGKYRSSRSSFMLSALGRGRSAYDIFLEKPVEALRKGVEPCARLECNLLCTSYTLKLRDCMVSALKSGVGVRDHEEKSSTSLEVRDTIDDDGEESAGGVETTLLKLKYKARMRGIMQPRRMEIDTLSSEADILQNKPPHWNEALNCWCLNFRGRVKLASVKNFQLVQQSAGLGVDDPVVMQFGKIDDDVFVLDFNPTILSPAQAFSVALSTFNGRMI